MAKRKRRQSGSHESRPRFLSQPPSPNGIINPFSRSSSEQRQLSVAGLGDAERDPSRAIRHFPHRRIGGDDSTTAGSDDEADALPDAAPRKGAASPRRGAAASRDGKTLDVLLRSIHQLLDRGMVERSARLFGAVLRLRPRARPIDIRQHGLWAIGAEIIMRGGEERARGPGAGQAGGSTCETAPARWGSPANMDGLRAYLETLMQEHPYDHRFPSNVSALDFQLLLLGCEVYNCHAEYSSAMATLDEDLKSWRRGPVMGAGTCRPDRDPDFRQPVATGEAHDPAEPKGVRTKKEHIRSRALRTMEAIANKMDILIKDLPYSKNHHFLNLRAAVSLFIGDLVLSLQDGSHQHEHEAAKATRQCEQETARRLMHRVLSSGGNIASPVLHFAGYITNANPAFQEQQLHATLPIRGP
ncbi:uncharacterized protein UV8b_00965 [Ustilaginoidea virens]|uniref:Uncharacterized protein n=1 Tax=Ustilaginoidea virens TaxID=1159556 RepID=A0A063C5W4_USTVR|nr:uncharacterized protein UV8b_00965 [Ustilaginoidea virens]QUC16724.1 hypothetical protein UV8b_00965 [Ustilaginoidea virens]GAO15721.1 hypothetical protein UVI_02043500 [Ustilaginoidea virens]